MKGLANRKANRPEDLCLACGLCCNGVIFADVKLLPQDNPAKLRSAGLPLLSGAAKRNNEEGPQCWSFRQPCAVFDGCRCGIYSSRPTYCRQFECLLLKELQAGVVAKPQALRVIRDARQLVDQVSALLAELETTCEEAALADRFRRAAKWLERTRLDRKSAEKFGQLTVAFHQLNLLLRARFYPAPAD